MKLHLKQQTPKHFSILLSYYNILFQLSIYLWIFIRKICRLEDKIKNRDGSSKRILFRLCKCNKMWHITTFPAMYIKGCEAMCFGLVCCGCFPFYKLFWHYKEKEWSSTKIVQPDFWLLFCVERGIFFNDIDVRAI